MQSSLHRKSRSNRPLTQFACGCLDLFMSINAYKTERTKGNTAIKCFSDDKIKKFQAFIHGNKILEVVAYENEPVRVDVCVSENFRTNGDPSEDVRERLNGLLDTLGYHKVLPDGVRLFKDREEEIFYLGQGEIRIPVGYLYAHKVAIEANATELKMTRDD